jgi:rsbT co-antagonist protein RsbR
MWQATRQWIANIPQTDPLSYRRAILFQSMCLALAVVAVLGLGILVFTPLTGQGRVIMLALDMLIGVLALVGLFMMRRGWQNAAVALLAYGFILALSTMLLGIGINSSLAFVFALSLPISVAGLLARRRVLYGAVALASISGSVAIILLRTNTPPAGFATPEGNSIPPSVVAYTLAAFLLGFFIDRLNTAQRETIETLQERERSLEQLRADLEAQVQRRTVDLQQALHVVEQRSAEQEQLLQDNQQQREALRRLSVPVLPISDEALVVPLVGELDDERLDMLRDRVLHTIERTKARRLLLDITGVPVIDTAIAQRMQQTIIAAKLLGAEVVLVGIRPEVAEALVSTNIDLAGITSYADLRTALGR